MWENPELQSLREGYLNEEFGLAEDLQGKCFLLLYSVYITRKCIDVSIKTRNIHFIRVDINCRNLLHPHLDKYFLYYTRRLEKDNIKAMLTECEYV